MPPQPINRVAITIVDGSQSRTLIAALNDAGFSVTILDAVGGFLHESMVTMLIGLHEARLSRYFSIVREKCPSRTRYVSMGVDLSITPGYPMMIEARVGGATIFVLPVERLVQL